MFDVRQPATLGQLTQLYMGNPNLTPTQVGNSLSMQPAGYINKQGEALGLGNPTQYFQKQYDARKSAMQAGEAQAYAGQSGQPPVSQAAPAPVASLQPRYSAASAMGDLAKAEARAQGLTDEQYNAMHGGLPGYGGYDQQLNRDNPQIERARQAEISKALAAGLPIPPKSFNFDNPNAPKPEGVPGFQYNFNQQYTTPLQSHFGPSKFELEPVLSEQRLNSPSNFSLGQDLAPKNSQVAPLQYPPAKPTHIVDYKTPEQFFDDPVFVRLMEENPDAANKLFTHLMKRDMNEVIKERRVMAQHQAVTTEARNYEAAQAAEERQRAADNKIAADELARHHELRGRLEKGDYKFNNDTGKWQKKKLVPNKKAQEEEDALGTGSKTLATMIWNGEWEDLDTNDPSGSELTSATNPEHQQEIAAATKRAQDPALQALILERKRRMEVGLPDSTYNGLGGIAAMPTNEQLRQKALREMPGETGMRRLFPGSEIDSPLALDSQDGNYYSHGLGSLFLQGSDTLVNYMPDLQNLEKGVVNFFGGRYAKTPISPLPHAEEVRAGMPANMGVLHLAPFLRDDKEFQRFLIEDRPRALAFVAAAQTQKRNEMSPEVGAFYDRIMKNKALKIKK